MSKYNPFEERRKNDRINRLVKENTELKAKVDKLEQYYDSKRLYADLIEQAVKVSQSQTQEIQEQNAELAKELAHVVKALKTVSSFGATTPIIEHAEGILTKYNHLKSNTNG